MGVERLTVRWVRTCEGRHPHRRRVSFKREQLVEIAILYRSKTQAAHARTLMLNTLLVPDANPERVQHTTGTREAVTTTTGSIVFDAQSSY